MTVKTIEIKEVPKKKQDLQKELTELQDKNFQIENLLSITSGGLEDIDEALTLVIDFIREERRADLRDPISCYNLVAFIQRYRIVLEMAKDKLNNLNYEIEKVL